MPTKPLSALPGNPCKIPEPGFIFVGGAPRSGTTLVHSLVCSTGGRGEVNDYVGESSFLTALIRSYEIGLMNWSNHTRYFFAARNSFQEHFRQLLSTALESIKAHLGNPKKLALKDPLLTPSFLTVSELLGDHVRFVVVIRNPYDVIRSRQQVFEIANPSSPFGPEEVRRFAHEFANSYRNFGKLEESGKLHMLRYEDLLDQSELNKLETFLSITGISEEGIVRDGADPENPWYSPKYGKKIDLENRFPPLKQEYKSIIDEICGALQQQYDYKRTGSQPH